MGDVDLCRFYESIVTYTLLEDTTCTSFNPTLNQNSVNMLTPKSMWLEKAISYYGNSPPAEICNRGIHVLDTSDSRFEIFNRITDGGSLFHCDMDAVRNLFTLNPHKLIKGNQTMLNNPTNQNTVGFKHPTFREIYTSCFTNGVATSESTSIHIARAVTTLCKDAHKYQSMHILIKNDPGSDNTYQDRVSILCKKWFPYGFFSHHLFIGFSTPETEDSIPEIVIDVSLRLSNHQTITLVIKYIENDPVEKFLAELKTLEYKPPVYIEQIKMLSNDGNCSTEKIEFDKDNNYEAHVEFYPFLKPLYPETEELTIEYIVKDFMSSKANLLLLIGPAGTAKSTLIRSFIRKEHEVLVVSSAQVLESPALPTTFRTTPSTPGKKMVTIYEDADIFVEPREKGNLALSSMLNQLDGVVSSKEKFIISTNLESISKVDKALLRPGRCHKVMQFRLLEGEEINVARAAIGKPPINCNKPLTLSEALHFQEIQIEDRKTPVFGFAPKGN